jgi:hypothetical protein
MAAFVATIGLPRPRGNPANFFHVFPALMKEIIRAWEISKPGGAGEPRLRGGQSAARSHLPLSKDLCPHESGVALPAAVHDAPRHADDPGKSVRVMDCAGKALAATALSRARGPRTLDDRRLIINCLPKLRSNNVRFQCTIRQSFNQE